MQLLITRLIALGLVLTLSGAPGVADDPPAREHSQQELVLVVMDPLSAPLACECVQGYAQRKYEALGDFLTSKLQHPVRVVWGGAIDVAAQDAGGQAHIIIGKYSVVVDDAQKLNLNIAPVASLTGLDGTTTQTGLLVVRSADPAQTVSDLQGYRIFFGPAECDEKSAAPMKLLRQHGVDVPDADQLETCGACSEAAIKLMELDASERAAAVISNYAKPLLEGCGSIQPGDLRIVGESDPVPFITVFVNRQLDAAQVGRLRQALADVKLDPALCQALETAAGFVPFKAVAQEPAAEAAKKK